MVLLRDKGVMDWDRPNYEPNSKYITLVLHFGGDFEHSPIPLYIGGKKLVFDWVKVDELKVCDLDAYYQQAGVPKVGVKHYHLRMRDMNFKLCIDDDDLRYWAHKCLDIREMHVFLEILPLETENNFEELDEEESDFEDPDFMIGNEVTDEEIEDEGRSGEPRDEARNKVDKHLVSPNSSESESENEDDKDVMEEEQTHDFDEFRLSDEDNDQPEYTIFNPSTRFDPEFTISQVFASKVEFKKAAESHAIKHRRNICFTKNDNRRIYAKCCDVNCKWSINALKRKNEAAFQIRKYYPKHTCATSKRVKNLTSTWLSEKFVQRFQSDPKRGVKGFLMDVVHDTRCEVSKQQAARAKSLTLRKIQGDPDAQYAKLWSYADELRKTNHGSTIILGTSIDNGVTLFNKFYVCFDAMKRGFKAGCRPILGIDGCHLKSKYGGILLTAVRVDGNNNLYPVAYAVVEKENGEIWEWFLTVLKNDLEIEVDEFTFMSDKQKGLIQAIDVVFPGVDHRFCVRHMHNNLKTAGYRGLAFKQAMWKAACSTTQGEFNLRMTELKNLSEGAWDWFKDKPGNQWSKAFFSEKAKCDMLLNNVCESFNSQILDARDKAIITMLEWIREHLMQRIQKNRDRAKAKWNVKLCPRISKIMEINMEKLADCIPVKCSDRHYQVSCYDGSQYTVDLERHICSCRLWQLTGYPCIHGHCAILKQQLDPEDFVHDYYSVETYLKAYEHPILGISYDVLWGDSLYIPPLPPNFGSKKRRGRIPTMRRKEADEPNGKKKSRQLRLKRQQTTLHCRKCRGEGHNAATCSSQTVCSQIQGRRTAVTKGAATSSLKTKPPSAKKVLGNNDVERVPNKKTKTTMMETDIHIAPPKIVTEEHSCGVSEVDIATQQSQVTNENWLIPTPTPNVQGPTMYQQLQMGKSTSQPGVNFRIPPIHSDGHFTLGVKTTVRPEALKKIIFHNGQKFMDLSSQGSSGSNDKKGKKKV